MEAKHSKGPWGASATPVIDRENIRNITDEDGNLVAQIRCRGMGKDQEALANARLIVAAPDMLEALDKAFTLLSEHPESKQGNSKIHYVMHLVESIRDKAIKE
jgi:hypothetical protein